MNSLNNHDANERSNTNSVRVTAVDDESRSASIDGLVLSVMDYKDSDGLVTLATPEELIKVYARGIQKEKSKNRRLFAPFSLSHINYDPKYSGEFLYLINGSVIDSWWKCSESLEIQTASALIVNLIERHGINAQIYSSLQAFWACAHKGRTEDALLAACKAVIEILREAGMVMNVDECVLCSRTDRIAGVSMKEGGFVCLDCLDHLEEDNLPWSKENLMLLRRLVRLPLMQLFKQPLRPKDFAMLIELFEWYQYYSDFRMRSLDFLKMLRKERLNAF